jgi:hypothetical protein
METDRYLPQNTNPHYLFIYWFPASPSFSRIVPAMINFAAVFPGNVVFQFSKNGSSLNALGC